VVDTLDQLSLVEMVDLVVEERTQALWVEQELLVKEMLELEQQIDQELVLVEVLVGFQ
jgi:hypothetical protein